MAKNTIASRLVVVILVSGIAVGILADSMWRTVLFRRSKILERISGGKIFSDTFSFLNGTATDEEWQTGFIFDGQNIQSGQWKVEDGKYREYGGAGSFAYPLGVLVKYFVWEAKVMPMSINQQGPEVRFLGYRGDKIVSEVAIDYIVVSHQWRLAIASGPIGVTSASTVQTHGFTMNNGTWYTLRVSIIGSLVECFLNSWPVMQSLNRDIDSNSSKIILHTGYGTDEWGYWDDVKVWKSNTLTIKNLKEGQSVTLLDSDGNPKSSNGVYAGRTEAVLNTGSLSFPFKGYFKIYADDSTSPGRAGTLLYTSEVYDDIWGGDEYRFSTPM